MKDMKAIENTGRQTLLAGVAVLDSGRLKAATNLDKLYIDINAFVTDLISRGEDVESELKEKVKGRFMLDEKISAIKAKLGLHKQTRDMQIDKLSTKVDRLIEAVAILAQQKEAETKAAAAKKAAAATKPAAAKPAAKTAASTASKAPAAPKTPTAAKAPAKPRTTRKTASASTASKPRTRAAAKPAASADSDKSE